MQAEQKTWTKEKGWRAVVDFQLGNTAQLVLVTGQRDGELKENIIDEVKCFYPNARIVFRDNLMSKLKNGAKQGIDLTAIEFEYISGISGEL